MTKDFERLSISLKLKLERRFGKTNIENNYIYRELDRITSEWKNQKLISKDTDIGIAAVKLLDSGTPDDSALLDDICRLAAMFNRRFRIEFLKNRSGGG